MNKTFTNSSHVEVTFNDDGVTFGGNKDQEVFYPYGCLDSLKMSFMGVLQATSHITISAFAVDRKDRAEMKEMLKFAEEKMKTAPRDEVRIIDLTKKDDNSAVDPSLPPEEQLKQYKALFVQGIISKEEYDARKRQLKNK